MDRCAVPRQNSAGRPIKSNRTFFFGNYEGIRQTQGNSSVATVPSGDARSGIIHNADGTVTTVAVDPSVAKYLTFWPTANGGFAPGSNGNIGVYDFSEPQVVQEDYAVARVDHRLSNRDSVFANYLYDRTPYTCPDSLNDIFFLSKTSRQIATVEETHTFSPTIVNTFRLGVNRDVVINNVGAQAVNPAVLDASLAAVPGQYAAEVSVPGLTNFTGGSSSSGDYYAWTSYQLGEDLFLSRGKHSIKVGFASELMRLNVLNLNTRKGQFVFTSLSGFLTNQPYLFSASTSGTVTPRDLQEMLFAGYVQDDWRASPNLTFNLGLRYESTSVVHEARGKLSNLVNISDPNPQLGNPYFKNPTTMNFEPRVGFAFSPFSDPKNVIRGAFGVYDVLPLPYEFILPSTFAAPFTQYGLIQGKLPAGTFYSGAEAYLNPYTLFGAHVQEAPKRNYVMQWNFNVQRQLTTDTALLIAYVGSRGLHLPYYSNQFNVVLPTGSSQGKLQWPIPIGSGSILNPKYGTIRGLDWHGDSYYDGLQVGLRKNMRHGLQFQVSYTQSKSIDDTSGSLAPDALTNSFATLPFFEPARGRGPSDFNVSRVLVVNGMAQVPQLHGNQPLISWLTKGWQLGTILTAEDGMPFTPTYGSDGDPLGSNGLQDFPDRLGGAGCSSLVNPRNYNNYVKTQCFAVPALGQLGNAGRNILTGPGILELDTSVFKNVQVPKAGDRVKLQFRAEFFNVLNHRNYAIPSSPFAWSAKRNCRTDYSDNHTFAPDPIWSQGQLLAASNTGMDPEEDARTTSRLERNDLTGIRAIV